MHMHFLPPGDSEFTTWNIELTTADNGTNEIFSDNITNRTITFSITNGTGFTKSLGFTDGFGNVIGNPSGVTGGPGYFTHFTAYDTNGRYADLTDQIQQIGITNYPYRRAIENGIPVIQHNRTDSEQFIQIYGVGNGLELDTQNDRINVLSRPNLGLQTYDTGVGLSSAFVEAASTLALVTDYRYPANQSELQSIIADTGDQIGKFFMTTVSNPTTSNLGTVNPTSWDSIRSIIISPTDNNTPGRSIAGLAQFFGPGSIVEIRKDEDRYCVWAINSYQSDFGNSDGITRLEVTNTYSATTDSDIYGNIVYAGIIEQKGTPGATLSANNTFEIIMHGRGRMIEGRLLGDGTVEIDKLRTTGTPSSTTVLHGDGSWGTAGAAASTPDLTFSQLGNNVRLLPNNTVANGVTFQLSDTIGFVEDTGDNTIVQARINSGSIDSDLIGDSDVAPRNLMRNGTTATGDTYYAGDGEWKHVAHARDNKVFTDSENGLVPTPGALDEEYFLAADGTWRHTTEFIDSDAAINAFRGLQSRWIDASRELEIYGNVRKPGTPGTDGQRAWPIITFTNDPTTNSADDRPLETDAVLTLRARDSQGGLTEFNVPWSNADIPPGHGDRGQNDVDDIFANAVGRGFSHLVQVADIGQEGDNGFSYQNVYEGVMDSDRNMADSIIVEFDSRFYRAEASFAIPGPTRGRTGEYPAGQKAAGRAHTNGTADTDSEVIFIEQAIPIDEVKTSNPNDVVDTFNTGSVITNGITRSGGNIVLVRKSVSQGISNTIYTAWLQYTGTDLSSIRYYGSSITSVDDIDESTPVIALKTINRTNGEITGTPVTSGGSG